MDTRQQRLYAQEPPKLTTYTLIPSSYREVGQVDCARVFDIYYITFPMFFLSTLCWPRLRDVRANRD